MDGFFHPKVAGAGMYGIIYALSDCVVAKVPRLLRDEAEVAGEFADEQEHYGRVGAAGRQASPYLVPVFHQVPEKAIFMLRAKTDLRHVLRDADGYAHDPGRTSRWMGQLCAGVAFLERHGVVHGDLRPDNVLVDHNGNLRLNDFGRVVGIGEDLDAASEPFGRKLSPAEGVPGGWHPNSYGVAGPRTDSFALGSIYYSLVRGYYPYEDGKYDMDKVIDLFCQKQFPALGDHPGPDRVIARCWAGEYESVAALEQEFRDMKDGTEWYRFDLEDADWFAEQKQKCEVWTANGNLDKLMKKRPF